MGFGPVCPEIGSPSHDISVTEMSLERGDHRSLTGAD